MESILSSETSTDFVHIPRNYIPEEGALLEKNMLLLYSSFNKLLMKFAVLRVTKTKLHFIKSHCAGVCWREVLSEIKEVHIFLLC
jgi:hypothetical protein